MRTRRKALSVAIASLVLAVLPRGVSAADPVAAKPSDFNGDGYSDLAIGVPGEDADGLTESGGVNVVYGSPTGLTANGDQFWSLDSPGIPGIADPNDWFGYRLASGDFDRDGFADLAVASGGGDLDTEYVHGSVTIIYGSAAGLTADGAQSWQDADLGPAHGFNSTFGTALATGDFDGDGYVDLAIAVTWDIGIGHGAVDVLFGGPDGLSAIGTAQVTQADLPGQVDEDVGFGEALTSGDFDNDGIDDLAIGRPSDSLTGETEDEGVDAGSVNVVYGTVDGPSTVGAQLWSQATPGIVGKVADADMFGTALATGDFDHDGFTDLGIGAPGDRIGGLVTGSITVMYGSAAGLSATDSALWHQGAPGVAGTNESGDDFGRTLAAGDFDSDGRDDIAVGAPLETVGRDWAAGAVTVLYGSSAGIRAARSASFTQDSSGVPGTTERREYFGASLAVGDYGRSSREELAISVPHEGLGAIPRAGVVDVLYGRLSGINGTNAQGWSQDSPGVKGTASESDYFGFALTR